MELRYPMIELSLLILGFSSCLGHSLTLARAPAPTKAATLDARAIPPTRMSICGYMTGDPSKAWEAPAGFDCRVDTAHGLWGFCPTTVIAATDCGLGGYCFDNNNCQNGCGRLSDDPSITTWTCTQSDPASRYCSFAYLTFGPDQTYDYYHCGPDPGTVHYLAQPTTALISTTRAESSSSASSTASFSSHSSSSLAAATSTSTLPPATSEPTAIPTAMPTAASKPTVAVETGAIIGGVIGGLALVCGCVVAVVYLKRDRARKRHSSLPDKMVGTPRKSWFQSQDIKAAGWGPSELPSVQAIRPVELPT